MEYNTKEIANRINERREIKGITQKNLLKELGFGINYIGQLSNGQNISSINLAQIADRLDVSVDYLLGRTDDPAIHYLNEKQFKLVARGGKNIDTTNKNTPTGKTPRTTKNS